MSRRDRLLNLGLVVLAATAWLGVSWVVVNVDPRADAESGYLGAALIGLASGLSAAPLFWLVAFTLRHRIAYRGAWLRAVRRGTWVGVLVGVVVVMRLQDLFQVPIALFLAALALVTEVALSNQR
ncbi:MAG TPA: hypothetical protein VK831_04160 [Candidatus Deferrimicrobiaceae bacterium]|nr:hypothetical protein [Candidatus Deferrimicrobiaceae bacterium]